MKIIIVDYDTERLERAENMIRRAYGHDHRVELFNTMHSFDEHIENSQNAAADILITNLHIDQTRDMPPSGETIVLKARARSSETKCLFMSEYFEIQGAPFIEFCKRRNDVVDCIPITQATFEFRLMRAIAPLLPSPSPLQAA